MAEEKVGEVVKFFGKISVAAITLSGTLKVGETIRFIGHTTDFSQKLDSMQIENQSVETAKAGDDIGIKVSDRVRPGDSVYRVTEA